MHDDPAASRHPISRLPSMSQFTLVAPLSGQVWPLERIPDPVFAQKIVGDGLSIDPTDALLVAPCAGESPSQRDPAAQGSSRVVRRVHERARRCAIGGQELNRPREGGPTMAKGTLIAAMNIGQAAEDEFNDWYDTEHMPERQRMPGFSCASAGSAPRTPRCRSQPTIWRRSRCCRARPTWRSPARISRRGRSASPEVERLSASRASRSCPETSSRRASAGGLLLVAMNSCPRPRPSSTRGTTRSTSRRSRTVPGVLCARRFRGSGNRKYVALYHLAAPEVQESAEWKQARQSDWTSRLQPHFRDHLRLVLRRYVRSA